MDLFAEPTATDVSLEEVMLELEGLLSLPEESSYPEKTICEFERCLQSLLSLTVEAEHSEE